MNFLCIRNLTAGYGSSQALHGVDMTMAEGEVMALMGRNGMGKTTTVKAICRMIDSEGTLTLGGHDLHSLPSHRVARLGVGLAPEGRRCFPDLGVHENLVAAARPGDWTLKTVTDLFPRLGERAGQRAASLSGGEQQMLAIGRALMTNPSLLILDEATEGLAPNVRQEIWRAICQLKARTGMAILLIDKSVRELKAISDKATVLARGRTVWAGSIDDLSSGIAERHIGV